MAKKESRFVLTENYGSEWKNAGVQYVYVDKQTGVNYLFIKSGYGAGLTPLLDKDGKPVITSVLK